MKKWSLVSGIFVVAVTIGVFRWVLDTPDLALADPDCPRDAPVMAIDLTGGLRQDDVAVIHRDGKVERLTDEHASWEASFSPDGEQLVFTSGREGFHEECCGFSDHEIYVMNSDGSQQRRLMERSNDQDWGPDWSPDGSRIAFVRDGRSLMLVNPQGEDPRSIHRARGEIRMWSGRRMGKRSHSCPVKIST